MCPGCFSCSRKGMTQDLHTTVPPSLEHPPAFYTRVPFHPAHLSLMFPHQRGIFDHQSKDSLPCLYTPMLFFSSVAFIPINIPLHVSCLMCCLALQGLRLGLFGASTLSPILSSATDTELSISFE